MNRELRPPPARYDGDVHRWSLEQAQLVRDGRFDAIDLANIAEELETLGRSEAAALRSSLHLIIHLLKLTHQPARASRSWRSTAVRERNNAALQINKTLDYTKLQQMELFTFQKYSAQKQYQTDLFVRLVILPFCNLRWR